MKKLNGSELAGFVKEKQAKEGRRLSAAKIKPKLAIISEGENEVNDLYLRLKQKYGKDIGVEVKLIQTKDHLESQRMVLELNEDQTVHGIVVQLPLSDDSHTDEVIDIIEPAKDVDGLGKQAKYTSASATAVLWLLSGYNIDLNQKKVVVIGRGRLVGAPLIKLLEESSVQPLVLDEHSKNLGQAVKQAEVLISATGRPNLITSDMIGTGTIVIDAGTSSQDGQIVGDVQAEAQTRDDITITPIKGGLGPLTICALFDNVLRAARAKVSP